MISDHGQTTQMLEHQTRQEKMRDKYYMNRIFFYVLGTLALVPQNFFITAHEYWMYKFRNTNEPFNRTAEPTDMQASFTSAYSIFSSITLVVTLILASRFGKKIPLKNTLLASMILMLTLFIVLIILVEVDTDSWQKEFFVLSLILGGLFSAIGAVLMMKSFILSSKFPQIYIALQISGQAICGVISAVTQIITIAAGRTPQSAGLIYFLIGASFVVFNIIFFVIIRKYSAFFNYYTDLEEEPINNSEKPTKATFLEIVENLKYYIFSMILIQGVTTVIFPSLANLINPAHSGGEWNDKYFVPVTCFLCHHLFDLIGRETANILKKHKNPKIFLIIGSIRIALIPLIMFCNLQPRKHTEVAFQQDWIYILCIILLAFSNGFFLNLVILNIPHSPNPLHRQIGYGLVFISMVVSLGLCNLLSLGLLKAL